MFVGAATNVAVGWAHRASILTAEDFRLGSKEQGRDFLSEQALNERKLRTPSKLMTRVRIPFTRSNLFNYLPPSVLKVDTSPGCGVDTNSPLLFPARMLRRPLRRALSALRTASISTGA